MLAIKRKIRYFKAEFSLQKSKKTYHRGGGEKMRGVHQKGHTVITAWPFFNNPKSQIIKLLSNYPLPQNKQQCS